MMRFFTLFALISSLSFAQELTHKVFFKTDIYAINSIEKNRLATFLKGLDTVTIKQITIYGFCDDRGSQKYNLTLSKKRANSVEAFLKDNEVSKELIKIIDGKGEINLKENNNIDDTRRNNRRVDLVVKTKYPKEEEDSYEKPTTQKILKGKLKVGDKIRLKNIYFKTGFATIVSSSIPTLTEITDILVRRENVYFTIEGHVCCTHDTYDAVDRKTNKRNLSHARAKFIYNYMRRKGIKKNRMKFIGMKRKQPLGGKPKYDRRVEILITHIADRD
jgi:outer membrane protein OmpA-like peptidoglycan-associated protein